MLGADAAYDGLPYFFSAQFGMAFEYVGRGNPTDDVVIRSKSEDGALGDGFAAFWTCDGVVQAGHDGQRLGSVRDGRAALIRAGEPIDPDRLADPDVPIGEVG